MNKIFFGFAIADSMFVDNCVITRNVIDPAIVKEMARDGVLTPCLNPSHKATIDAMRRRFGIEVEIPKTAPQVSLNVGDELIVMGVRGLQRLTDRHEYTQAEIDAATFTFSRYTVVE